MSLSDFSGCLHTVASLQSYRMVTVVCMQWNDQGPPKPVGPTFNNQHVAMTDRPNALISVSLGKFEMNNPISDYRFVNPPT